MSFFGVYIPPSKDGFEGTAAKCAGSIAAINIRTSPEMMAGAATSATAPTATGTNDIGNDYKYEDPEYPPDSPLWLIFMEKSKALDVLRIYKEGRLREFPNREQAESYVQFGFESIESLKRFGKSSSSNSKSASKTNPHSPSNNHIRGTAGGSNSTDGGNGGATANWSPYSSSPTSGSGNSGNAGSPLSSICSLLANFSNQSSTANHHNNINNNNNNSITMSRPESSGSLSTSSAASATTTTSSSSSSIVSSASSSSSSSAALSSINAERQAFRAPTKQELVEFRKLIEVGNVSRVKRIVWENPRYIISNGDTPTSLKEGYRYNAMHICAQTNQARVAELLLKILADREFTQLFVGKKGSGEMCAALNDNILDYYLNMPDKGRGETPLHFAVKNGHVAMVEVLISYPQCKSLANIEGKYPKDIICYRAPNAGPEIVKKLQVLLSDPYYVPVLRAAGNELPPQVGQPYTPHEQPVLQSICEENERLSVDLAISAVAGPMPRDTAFNFYRRWKTPPRISNNTLSPLTATPHSPYDSPVKTTPNKSIFNRSSHYGNGNGSPNLPSRRVLFSPKLLVESNSMGAQESSPSSPSLCIENNNNNNCLKMLAGKRRLLDLPATPIRQMRRDVFEVYRNNQDCEQSPIAGDLHSYSMMDISSPRIGMDDTWNDSFRERHIKNSDIEKGLEVVGRHLAHQEQLEWREYWDFLDAFVDITMPDGLNCFESYLLEKSEQEQQALLLQQQQAQSERITDQNLWNFAQLDQYLDLVAEGLDKELESSSSTAAAAASGALTNITNNHKTTTTTTITTQVMTPYTCVEKSLQVFAKRITKTIINNIGNMVSINDTLLSELKRLKSLIVSFKDDSRFLTVDFSKVHSRIAHLVASYIAHSQEVSVAMCLQLLQMLRKLLQLAGERREHLECVCAGLRSMLETTVSTAEAVSPDALKTEDLCSAAWEAEKSCACIWDANLSRKTSRRKRTESYRAAQAQAKSQAHNQAQVNMQTQPMTSQTAASLRVGSMTNVAAVTSGKKSTFTDWRCTNNNSDDDDDDDNGVAGEDSEDDDDERTLYYDCQYFDSNSINSSDDEQEDLYLTPPDNLSPRHSIQLDEFATPRYELFIFGKEPTKRDLDVLNAIFNVDIKKETLPHVHAWKSAMESFSAAEMELFPSPRNIKKTHKPIYASNGNGGGRPLKAGQNGGSTSEAVPLF